MNPGLTVINRILYTDLRPSGLLDKPADFFKSRLNEIQVQPIRFHSGWEGAIDGPLTTPMKYYKALIDHDCNLFYNQAVALLLQEGAESINTYYAHVWLEKTISPQLKNLKEVMDFFYQEEVSASAAGGFALHYRETAYIFNYLKAGLLSLYLNIQERCSKYLPDPPLDETALLMIFFNEDQDDKKWVRRRQAKDQPIEPELVAESQATGYSPGIKEDEQEDELSLLLVQPTFFEEVKNRLVEYKIIDKQYRFLQNRKQQNARLLAVVCRLIIGQKIFRQSHPDLGNKKYLEKDYIRLLSRYFNHNIGDSYKKITPDHIAQARQKLFWLSQLFPEKKS